MSAPAWTPGPWFADQSPMQYRYGQWSIGIGRGTGVRESDPSSDGYMLVTGICRDADARLIAAAPDLVEALAEIKTLLSAARNDGKSEAVREGNANAAWHTADAALTKAGAL